MILALDPATKTGWATKDDSGMEIFSKDACDRVGEFYRWLINLVLSDDIEMIVYEKPGGANYNGVRSHSQLEGVIMLVAGITGCGFLGLSAGEIKKFATGNGRAKKDEMIQACKEKLGIDPIDDNHADAAWIYDYAINGGILTFCSSS